MILDAEGVALHLDVAGSGEPVVCLHGHALDLRMWDDLVPELSDAGFRVARYDLRGHGRSSSPSAGYRWGDHAADLATVLDHLGGGAHLVGLSKGAGVALELVLRAPERIRSLVLISPWVPDHALSSELKSSLREIAARVGESGVAAAMAEGWLHHPLVASAMAIPGVRERVEAMAMTFPGGEYLAARDACDREWRVVDRLAEISAPALVISGAEDLEDFRAMAATLTGRLPRARQETVAGAGHLVPLEQPQRVAEAVTTFLSQQRGERTGPSGGGS